LRKVALAGVVWLFAGVAVNAETPDPQLIAPIQKFIDAFNKGDAAGAASTHAATAELVIIDEVPPYAWHGAKAFQSWSADLDSDAKKNALTDMAVTISAPVRVETKYSDYITAVAADVLCIDASHAEALVGRLTASGSSRGRET